MTILADNFITDKDKKDFVIYKGQKLEADIAYIEIYQQAKKSIYVVDDYMNANHYSTFHRKQMAWKLFYSQRMEKVGEDFLRTL